jgi:hypothetical protein
MYIRSEKEKKKGAEFTRTSEAVNLGSPTRDHHVAMISVPDLIARGLALHLDHKRGEWRLPAQVCPVPTSTFTTY